MREDIAIKTSTREGITGYSRIPLTRFFDSDDSLSRVFVILESS